MRRRRENTQIIHRRLAQHRPGPDQKSLMRRSDVGMAEKEGRFLGDAGLSRVVGDGLLTYVQTASAAARRRDFACHGRRPHGG
jgi:hypothetical protein